MTSTFVNIHISSSGSSFTQPVCPPPTHTQYLCALLGPLLSTLGPHHLCLRLTLNSAGHYSSGCVAASRVVSYRVEAVGFKVPTTPWRDMNYSHASFHHPPTHPPPHCTTNSAETTNINSSASASLQKAHDTLSITDAKSPQQAVLMWSLPAWRQERGEMLQSRYPPPPLTHTCTLEGTAHTLCPPHISHSSFSAPLLTHTVDDTHTHTHTELFFIFTLFPPQSVACAEGAVKVG